MRTFEGVDLPFLWVVKVLTQLSNLYQLHVRIYMYNVHFIILVMAWGRSLKTTSNIVMKVHECV